MAQGKTLQQRCMLQHGDVGCSFPKPKGKIVPQMAIFCLIAPLPWELSTRNITDSSVPATPVWGHNRERVALFVPGKMKMK